MDAITYRNRESGELETEQVYGEGFLRWAYGNPLGKIALESFVKRPFFSAWYGRKMSKPGSAQKVAPFIKDYALDEEEFADPSASFQSFNDFFYRKLRPTARPVADTDVVLPADGRHLGFEKASAIEGVFVKGQTFDLPKLLGSQDLAEQYADGSLLISRLCPVDYHRFHFCAAGTPSETVVLPGSLYSVSPLALRQRLAYFWENKRTLTRLATDDLGQILCLEIGATCVGTIEQTFIADQPVEKAAEKGYFAFGGSCTITLFEPGKVTLSDDLLQAGRDRIELYAKMGTPAATRLNP